MTRWGGSKRAVRAGLASVALLVAVGPQVSADVGPDAADFALGEKDAVFWETSLDETVPSAVACAAIGTACATFELDVLEPAWRLRVALDRPSASGELTLELLDPDGVAHQTPVDVRRDATQSAFGLYSMELLVDRPAVGRWTVRVSSRSGPPTGLYRMRAKLEAEPKVRSQVKDLLPNLRPIPPFELTFADPGPDSANGCRIQETQEHGAQGPCLRFATGPSNIGAGPLDLRYAGGVIDGPIQQRIHRSDGSWYEVDGGAFHYHVEHAHYHHDSIGAMVLSRVEPDGTLTYVGEAPKNGYCMYDYLIAEWDRFVQAPARPVEDQVTGCGVVLGPTGANLGLTEGWGDVYGWQTLGNFVDFAGSGDGEYVLTMTSDFDGSIVESDDSDNTAYTWFEVTGRTIEVLERGIGTGPADPAKVVVHDTRLPTVG